MPRHELKLTVEGQPTISVAQRARFIDTRAGDIAGIMVKDIDDAGAAAGHADLGETSGGRS